MALDGALLDATVLLARALFGCVLGYLAIGNLLSYEDTVAYARSKGAPLAGVAVPVMSVVLLAGAASIALGAFPALGALAVIVFLLGVTPVMHDFWTLEGMDRQNEQVAFLKNVGLLAGALFVLALSSVEWSYAIGAGL
jgi:putative oxidoreductase